jgi:hypothetical protein
MKSSFKKLENDMRTLLDDVDFDIMKHKNVYKSLGRMMCRLGPIISSSDGSYFTINETWSTVTKEELIQILDSIPLDPDTKDHIFTRQYSHTTPIRSQEFLDTFNLTEEEFDFLEDHICIDKNDLGLRPYGPLKSTLNKRFFENFIIDKFFK